MGASRTVRGDCVVGVVTCLMFGLCVCCPVELALRPQHGLVRIVVEDQPGSSFIV